MKAIGDWAAAVTFGSNGPQPQIFSEDNRLKVILAGLEPGQRIPVHPEGSSVYTFLEGRGTMHVDGEIVPVEQGNRRGDFVLCPAGRAIDPTGPVAY